MAFAMTQGSFSDLLDGIPVKLDTAEYRSYFIVN
jgi:hypothetical protein